MREKIKGNMKKILPILMCFMLIFGSCVCVNAAKVSAHKAQAGEEAMVYASASYLKNGAEYIMGTKIEYKINSAQDEIRVIPVVFRYNDTMGGVNYYFVSKKVFNMNIYYNGSSSTDDVCSNITSLTSGGDNQTPYNLTFNGTKYYYINYGQSISSSDIDFTSLKPVSSSYPMIHFNDYIDGYMKGDTQLGALFEKMYLADFTWDDGNGPTEPSLDSASMNTSLGYLTNISYASYIQQNSDGYPIDAKYVIGWSNNHPEWDDSYRVAHYIQVRADIRSVGSSTKSLYSDKIFVDDAAFSSCSSSFLNSSLVETEQYKNFISNVESQSNALSNYVTGYTHYLIIYHETDNGIEYGYWNQITSDNFEASSVGKVPSYGIIGSDGEFVVVEKFDRLEDYEIGVGDSIEDAENNADIVTPNFDSLPSIETIGDFMEYFQEMMASLFETIGSLPKYIAEFFSFLPVQIITCLTLGILIAIILRIVGR